MVNESGGGVKKRCEGPPSSSRVTLREPTKCAFPYTPWPNNQSERSQQWSILPCTTAHPWLSKAVVRSKSRMHACAPPGLNAENWVCFICVESRHSDRSWNYQQGKRSSSSFQPKQTVLFEQSFRLDKCARESLRYYFSPESTWMRCRPDATGRFRAAVMMTKHVG